MAKSRRSRTNGKGPSAEQSIAVAVSLILITFFVTTYGAGAISGIKDVLTGSDAIDKVSVDVVARLQTEWVYPKPQASLPSPIGANCDGSKFANWVKGLGAVPTSTTVGVLVQNDSDVPVAVRSFGVDSSEAGPPDHGTILDCQAGDAAGSATYVDVLLRQSSAQLRFTNPSGRATRSLFLTVPPHGSRPIVVRVRALDRRMRWSARLSLAARGKVKFERIRDSDGDEFLATPYPVSSTLAVPEGDRWLLTKLDKTGARRAQSIWRSGR